MFLVRLCSSRPVYWLGSFHSLAPHEIHERINTHKHRISDVNSKKVMHWYYTVYIYYITCCMLMRFNWRYSGSEKLLAQVSISQQNSKNTKQRVGSAPSRLWQQCPTQAFRIQACQQNGGNTLQRSISGSLNLLQSFSPTDFQTSLWGNKAGLRHVLAEGGTRRAGRITHLEIAMYCCHLINAGMPPCTSMLQFLRDPYRSYRDPKAQSFSESKGTSLIWQLHQN